MPGCSAVTAAVGSIRNRDEKTAGTHLLNCVPLFLAGRWHITSIGTNKEYPSLGPDAFM
jgi:hypothetical protein